MGDVIQRLRGQLQNCVNHLERASRHWNGTASDYDACIESANRCLYETLDADPYAELEALRERVRWIPVEERLPDDHGLYVVRYYDDAENLPDSDVAAYHPGRGRWVLSESGIDGQSVTHWQTLPDNPPG